MKGQDRTEVSTAAAWAWAAVLAGWGAGCGDSSGNTADTAAEGDSGTEGDSGSEADACPPPAGNVYWVSPAGDDSAAGTALQPWRTVQRAADATAPGDTVLVQEGNYGERVNVTISGASCAPITYEARGAAVLKGFAVRRIESDPYRVLPVDYIVIRGFEIADTDYHRWSAELGAGVFVKGAHVVIEDNDIHDCALEGIALYGPPEEPTVTADCTVRNNRLQRNEMVGINVNGRNHLIEGNEVWGTVQCHPALMAVEDHAADNPDGLGCPHYPAVGGLDADGMRFFGRGHVFRRNHIHDIAFGPSGVDPAIADYNDDPHIDCFQTWTGTFNETAQDIVFDGNLCENLQSQAERENGHGFMLAGGTNNLLLMNNIIRAYGGINTGGEGGAHHLFVHNNLWINDLSFDLFYPGAIGLESVPYAVVRNNIFYNQPYHTIVAVGDTTGQEIDHNLAFNADGSPADCFRVGDYVCRDPVPDGDLWDRDPVFVDPATGDFHLQSASPAIDAGVTVSAVVGDRDGQPRPAGAGYDIGPYEMQ